MVTPLTVGGPDDPAIPVVRGWLPGEDPATAPPPPTGTASVVGWLQPGEGTGAADDDPTDDVLPQVRIADLVQRVDVDLYGGYVVVDPEATEERRRPQRRYDGPRPRHPRPAPAGRDVHRPGATSRTRSSGGCSRGFALFLWWRFVREATVGSAA